MRLPFHYLIDNGMNGIRLIEACVRHGVSRFILSSTCAVYGTPATVPIPEDAPQNPESPYGEGKRFIERALYWADRIHGLRFAALRYFNAAGADPAGRIGEDHRPETHLIPLVIDAALGRRPELDVYGNDYATPDGTCIRDYVHVNDLADAHIRAVDRLERGSVTLNLGIGAGHSVLQVIDAVQLLQAAASPIGCARAARAIQPRWSHHRSTRNRNSTGGRTLPTWMRSCAPRCHGARRTPTAMATDRSSAVAPTPIAAEYVSWPGLLIGCPLVRPCAGTCLAQTIALCAGWDRPVFHSYFLLPLHLTITTWPEIAPQALLRGALWPDASPWWLPPILLVLTVTLLAAVARWPASPGLRLASLRCLPLPWLDGGDVARVAGQCGGRGRPVCARTIATRAASKKASVIRAAAGAAKHQASVMRTHAANALWSGAEAALSAMLSFASAFIVARLIGPAEVGIGAAVVAVHVLLWVGVNALFADALVQRSVLDGTTFSSAFIASVTVGCVAALIQAGTAQLLHWLLADDRLIMMSLLLAATLPLVGAAGPVQGLLTRDRAYRMLALRTVVGQGLGTLVGVASALHGAGAWSPW